MKTKSMLIIKNQTRAAPPQQNTVKPNRMTCKSFSEFWGLCFDLGGSVLELVYKISVQGGEEI